MMGWGGQGYGMWGMGWFGGIMMFFFWVIIIVGIILVVRYLLSGQHAGSGVPRDRDPLDILKERYARGEIGTEEYEEKRKILEGGR
ncbi:MAG: SHOCT domain-containing protein [Proteobacteria bacterium]|nr:SHOCT domain-containing protein [Pseudomonadota bacterium]